MTSLKMIFNYSKATGAWFSRYREKVNIAVQYIVLARILQVLFELVCSKARMDRIRKIYLNISIRLE